MQVVSFDTSSSIPASGLARVLPGLLPDDMWIVDAADAPNGFDARRSALRRWYRYSLWRCGTPPAHWQGRCRVYPQPLDVAGMRRASRSLLGRHDFGSFVTRPSKGGSTQRTVFAADWLQIGRELLVFEICADAYLKQMVRAIVGSLLWVGEAHWTPEQFAEAMARADRRAAGPNAPAVGLSLYRIEY